MSKKIGIYKFENKKKLNSLGKPMVYIGQSIDIYDRYIDHKNTNSKKPLYEDFKEFGFDNFSFEIIKECKPEELNNWEKYYIKEYDCIYPNGYNLTVGGGGIFIEANPEILERHIEVNTNENNPMYGTSEERKGTGNPLFNFRHSEESLRKIAERSHRGNHPGAKKIEDKSGRVWNCLIDCEEELGITKNKLVMMLNGHRNFYKHIKHLDLHYLNSRPDDYEFVPLEELEKNAVPKKERTFKKPLSQISENKKEIIDNTGKVYYSVYVCSNELDINVNSLRDSLQGKRHFPKSIEHLNLKYVNDEYNQDRYKFEKDREYFDNNIKKEIKYTPEKPRNERTIKVTDDLGRVWNSISECSTELNINADKLSQMLKKSINFPEHLLKLNLRYYGE